MKNDKIKNGKAENGGKIRITMVHGLGSCTKRQIATAKALGIARPGDTRELPNNPATIGACKKLEHLVKVEILGNGAGAVATENANLQVTATPQQTAKTINKGGKK
jgi:large subunit ribosomal protein L30